jgi:hypothetical protein
LRTAEKTLQANVREYVFAKLFGKGRVRQSPHILRHQLRSCESLEGRSAFGVKFRREGYPGSVSVATVGALLLLVSQETLRTPRPALLSVLRLRGCLQTTPKLDIIIMSSCSRLWQWKTYLPL